MHVLQDKGALFCVCFVYAEKHAYFLVLQCVCVLVWVERVETFDEHVCLSIQHVICVEPKPPVSDVVILRRVVHVVKDLWQIVDT